ncbi:hypothetical protein Efla_007035 [Eimeria flavescens]
MQLRDASAAVHLNSPSETEGGGERAHEGTPDRVQDKWLSDRLTEYVNWNRLSVDSAALSRVLMDAKQVTHGKAGLKKLGRIPAEQTDNFLVELLRQSEMLADNLDQLLGLLHRLEREATAEGVGFGHNGWHLVMSTEEALGAAGAFAEALDEATINAHSSGSHGEALPAMALQLSTALNNFGPDPTGGRLHEAIGKQQLVPLLEDLSKQHLATQLGGCLPNSTPTAKTQRLPAPANPRCGASLHLQQQQQQEQQQQQQQVLLLSQKVRLQDQQGQLAFKRPRQERRKPRQQLEAAPLPPQGAGWRMPSRSSSPLPAAQRASSNKQQNLQQAATSREQQTGRSTERALGKTDGDECNWSRCLGLLEDVSRRRDPPFELYRQLEVEPGAPRWQIRKILSVSLSPSASYSGVPPAPFCLSLFSLRFFLFFSIVPADEPTDPSEQRCEVELSELNSTPAACIAICILCLEAEWGLLPIDPSWYMALDLPLPSPTGFAALLRLFGCLSPFSLLIPAVSVCFSESKQCPSVAGPPRAATPSLAETPDLSTPAEHSPNSCSSSSSSRSEDDESVGQEDDDSEARAAAAAPLLSLLKRFRSKTELLRLTLPAPNCSAQHLHALWQLCGVLGVPPWNRPVRLQPAYSSLIQQKTLRNAQLWRSRVEDEDEEAPCEPCRQQQDELLHKRFLQQQEQQSCSAWLADFRAQLSREQEEVSDGFLYLHLLWRAPTEPLLPRRSKVTLQAASARQLPERQADNSPAVLRGLLLARDAGAAAAAAAARPPYSRSSSLGLEEGGGGPMQLTGKETPAAEDAAKEILLLLFAPRNLMPWNDLEVLQSAEAEPGWCCCCSSKCRCSKRKTRSTYPLLLLLKKLQHERPQDVDVTNRPTAQQVAWLLLVVQALHQRQQQQQQQQQAQGQQLEELLQQQPGDFALAVETPYCLRHPASG